MKQYIVTWDTKENRREYPHKQTFRAENAKAARKEFDRWYGQKIMRYPLNHYPHPFHIKVTLDREAGEE